MLKGKKKWLAALIAAALAALEAVNPILVPAAAVVLDILVPTDEPAEHQPGSEPAPASKP